MDQARGVCLTLYHGEYPDRMATPEVLAYLKRGRPQAVMLHGGPRALLGRDPTTPKNKGVLPTADLLRKELPGTELWLGIGTDGWVRSAAKGDADEGYAWLVNAALLASQIGAKVAMWNSEAASEEHPAVAAALAKRVIAEVQRCAPAVAQAFTSYPLYSFHARLPFAAWHTRFRGPEPTTCPAKPGTAGGVVATAPQLYVGAKASEVPPRGALQGLVKRHLRDRAAAVEKGWIPADTAWWWYLQAHGTDPADMVAVATGPQAPEWLIYWALPTRADAKGKEAILAVCDARRAPAPSAA